MYYRYQATLEYRKVLKFPALLPLTQSITASLVPSLSRVEQKLPLRLKASLIKVMPKILLPTLRIVPFSAQKSLLIPALHSIFSEAIEDGDFEFLQGKWLKISITDLQLNWWLSFDQDQLIMASPKENMGIYRAIIIKPRSIPKPVTMTGPSILIRACSFRATSCS